MNNAIFFILKIVIVILLSFCIPCFFYLSALCRSVTGWLQNTGVGWDRSHFSEIGTRQDYYFTLDQNGTGLFLWEWGWDRSENPFPHHPPSIL